MSNLLPTFNGVAAFGSIQSLASEYSLYPSVPQILIADGTLPQSGRQAANLILTNTYAPSFGPLAVPYLGYGPFNTAIDGLQINSIWTPSQPLANQTLSAASTATTYSFSLTSVSATIGQEYNGYAIYTGTITGGASNAFAGYTFTITGFSNAVNNGSGALLCIASTATTLTLANGLAIAESASANAASGTTVYTGTFTGGTSNAYAGGSFTIAGFTNGGNNGSFICTASSPTTITLLNSAGIAESHVATAQLNGNMLFSGASIFVTVAPVGNPDLDDSAYVTGLSVGMNTAAQANFSGSSSAMGVVAIETENSVGLPAGNTSTVFINQVIGLYTESLIGNFSNPDGVYNMNDHWNYHCAGMGWIGHATGTITNSSGIFMEGPRVPTGCTLTTRAGIYMQPQNQNSGGTNTNAWGILESSTTERNALGSINIGGSTGPLISTGSATPEGAITSVEGGFYFRSNGLVYAKVSGSGSTGWSPVNPGIRTATTTDSATNDDGTILCNGTFTETLPTTGIYPRKKFVIKNIGTGVITVSSSVNIDGSHTQTLSSQYQSITVEWDGTQYWIE